jgi:hypothetical protein
MYIPKIANREIESHTGKVDADTSMAADLQTTLVNEDGSVPTGGSWTEVNSCCCCGPLVRLTDTRGRRRYFLRHWECEPPILIMSSVLTAFCLGTYFICVVPEQSTGVAVFSSLFILFFASLFLYTYFAAACMDPGFLPFTWVHTQRFWYSWQEQLDGLAVTEAQFAFARSHRAPGCSFSASSGRFVIRADHICGWIGNWVGKRNHKQFILFNFYGFWLGISICAFTFVQPPLFDLPRAVLIVELIAAGIGGVMGLSMLAMFGQLLADLAQNRTKIQRMRNVGGGGEYSCEESMREVCGEDGIGWWICPTAAFDERLVVRPDDEHTETAP